MRTLVTVATLLCLLASNTSFAVVDPDPDQMGIYFDECADTFCILPVLCAPQFAYLIYTNPSLAAVDGYELGLTVTCGNATFDWPEEWCPLLPLDLDNVFVAFAEPRPTSVATILARATVMPFDLTPINIYLHGAANGTTGDPLLPGVYYYQGQNLKTLATGVSGGPGNVTAQITCDCGVVADETSSWGGVKSLFR